MFLKRYETHVSRNPTAYLPRNRSGMCLRSLLETMLWFAYFEIKLREGRREGRREGSWLGGGRCGRLQAMQHQLRAMRDQLQTVRMGQGGYLKMM